MMADRDDETRVRRTVLVGPHGGPRRIPLPILEVLISRIRHTVDAVASDLGLEDGAVSDVALVDLVGGSGGAVLEQTGQMTSGRPLPLAIAVDSATSYLRGEPLPPILTHLSAAAVKDMVAVLAAHSTPDAPIAFAHVDTVYSVDDSAPHELLAAVEIPPSFAKSEIDSKGDPQLLEEPEKDLTERTEWLLTFTGKLRRLDAVERSLWVVTTRGLAKAKVTEPIFHAADEDRARWKMVTVVCLSERPDVDKIIDVLHVTPAEKGSPEFEAVPMNEASKGLGDVLLKIDRFARLKKGWNSYDGQPINAGAQKAARGFLLVASSALRAGGVKLLLPFAAPLPNGNVQLEWEQAGTYLELEFKADGRIEYLRMVGDEAVEAQADRERALELVAWYHRRVAS